MKSFLLRFKGTIFASAQIKKMTKISEKNNVIYVYGLFDKIRAEEPPLRFSWMEENMFISLQTDCETHLVSSVYFT